MEEILNGRGGNLLIFVEIKIFKGKGWDERDVNRWLIVAWSGHLCKVLIIKIQGKN